MSKLTNNTTSLEQILEDLKTKATPSGGTNTNDATATAADLLKGKTAYVKGQKITGTIITRTQATPFITIDSSGLITASATQAAGYVAAGTKSATKQLTRKGATIYTPGTSNQTIAASTYLTGVQTIKGDSNLVASNIKSGTSIFGVTGTYEGSGGGGSLETCTVTFALGDPLTVPNVFIVTYMNSSSQIVTTEISIGDSITCLKNSIIAVQNCPFATSLSGGLSEIFYALKN